MHYAGQASLNCVSSGTAGLSPTKLWTPLSAWVMVHDIFDITSNRVHTYIYNPTSATY